MNRAGLHNSAPAADTTDVVFFLRALRCGRQVRFVVIVGFGVSLAACASTGAVYTPRPFPVPGGGAPAAIPAPEAPGTPAPMAPVAPIAPMAPGVPAASTDGYALSGTALSLRGAPYRPGGGDPSGFDCSGFVQYVYRQHGVAVPREVREQFRAGKAVDRDRLQPGDLVFFSTVAPGASHVGIVIGGDQFVHAPSERGVVRVETLSARYWASRFIGARRVS